MRFLFLLLAFAILSVFGIDQRVTDIQQFKLTGFPDATFPILFGNRTVNIQLEFESQCGMVETSMDSPVPLSYEFFSSEERGDCSTNVSVVPQSCASWNIRAEGFCKDVDGTKQVFCFAPDMSKVFDRLFSLDCSVFTEVLNVAIGNTRMKGSLYPSNGTYSLFFNDSEIGVVVQEENGWKQPMEVEKTNFDQYEASTEKVLCQGIISKTNCLSISDEHFNSEEFDPVQFCNPDIRHSQKRLRLSLDDFKKIVDGGYWDNRCNENNFLKYLIEREEIKEFKNYGNIRIRSGDIECNQKNYKFNDEDVACTDCSVDYFGDNCQYPICSNTMKQCSGHGECLKPRECRCREGYGGLNCELELCGGKCKNGNCVGPELCRCDFQYTGQWCDVLKCSPKCENGGKCEKSTTQSSKNPRKPRSTAPKCNCSTALEGYYGKSCDEKIGNEFTILSSRIVRIPWEIRTTSQTQKMMSWFHRTTMDCNKVIINSNEIFGRYPKTFCFYSCSDQEEGDTKCDQLGKTKYLYIETNERMFHFTQGTSIAKLKPFTWYSRLDDDTTIRVEFKPSKFEAAKAIAREHASSAVMVVVIVVAVLAILCPVIIILCCLVCCVINCQVFCCCWRCMSCYKDMMSPVRREQKTRFKSFQKLEEDLDDEVLDDGPNQQNHQDIGSILEEIEE